jgi:TP901 family phage tail tape measure protein
MEAFSLKATLDLDSSKYEQGLGEAKSKATSIGGAIGKGLATIGKVAGVALGAASAAVGKFTTDALRAGSNFDKSMSQVAATMGLTMDEMKDAVGSTTYTLNGEVVEFTGTLRDFAQEMGRNTAFSASQAADALNYMALAGYDVETSMSMLPNVLNLAAAGNMELARASDMVTDAATAFGLTLEDGSVDIERTTQMVDEMAKAASTGNTSVEQLGDAFLVVGGLAQELNGGMVELSDGTTATYDNIQELEIALTAMANAGIKGGEAGTHLRNMLLKLASPTDDGVKQFEALGVTVFDSEGKMRSLSNIMGDLGSSMENLTQEEKLQAISDIFNTRDTAAAEALLQAVGGDWDHIAESILDADGAASQMAETQLDNLAGDVTLFKSALEGAQIAISDGLTPDLRDFVKFGTKGLSDITAAFQEGGITGAMETFGTILSDGLNMIIGKLPGFVNAGMQLLGALGQGILDNLPVLIDTAVQIINQLVNGIIGALPALAEGAIQIIVGLANGITQMLPTLTPTIVEVVLQIVQALIDNAPLLLDAAVQLIQGLVDGFLNAIPVLIQMAPKLITSLVNALVAAIPILVQGTIKLVQGIIKALPTIISALISAIPQLIDAYINGLLTYLPELINGAVQLVLALVEALPQIIEALVTAIPVIIQTITDALLANLPQLIDGLVQVTIALVAAMPQIISALIEAIPQIITMIVNALITAVPMILEAVVSILATIGSKLVEYGSTLVENAGEAMSNLINAVVEWLSQLPIQMAYWAGFAIGSFIKFFMDLPANLQTWFVETIQKVIIFATELKTNAINAGRNFFNGIINNIKQLPERLKALGASLVSAVSSLPSKFIEIGKNIVSGLWNGIQEKWQWLKDKVSELANSLLQGAKDALGIQSPSKEFAWVGRMVDEGFAKGIDNFAYLVDDAINSITGNALQVEPQVAFAGNAGGGYGAGYNQTVNVYSPTALDPSEVARQTRNATRSMILELRGKR